MKRGWVALLVSINLYASTDMNNSNDVAYFQKVFENWTNAFNNRKLAETCDLFDKNIQASYQGVPPKTYSVICDGFKKTFSEPRKYQYDFKIRQVYRSNDLAVVRITWYLKMIENNKMVSSIQDEGMDVLENKNGKWRIINYLGYPMLGTLTI